MVSLTFFHVSGSKMAILTGTPAEPTEQYKNSEHNVTTPNHTVVKRSINDMATRGSTTRYHQTDPISPNLQNDNIAAAKGSNQNKLPGHLKNGWVFNAIIVSLFRV